MEMADSYDAVVIGGGVIGTSTLFNLMRLGCRRALLLERGELAGGATAKSSGIVRTHYSVVPNVAIARASLRMFEQFSSLLDDPEADAGLVRSGYLIVAPPGEASSAVRRSIAMQQKMGVACGLLDRVEALARHPWLKLDGIDAIGFEAEAGFADPYLVTTGFARLTEGTQVAVSSAEDAGQVTAPVVRPRPDGTRGTRGGERRCPKEDDLATGKDPPQSAVGIEEDGGKNHQESRRPDWSHREPQVPHQVMKAILDGGVWTPNGEMVRQHPCQRLESIAERGPQAVVGVVAAAWVRQRVGREHELWSLLPEISAEKSGPFTRRKFREAFEQKKRP